MRGLPFPSSAQYDREASYDYGSPLNVATTIPIDPALGGPLIDPAIMREAEALVPVPVSLFVSRWRFISDVLRHVARVLLCKEKNPPR
jgi:hypothetical protein